MNKYRKNREKKTNNPPCCFSLFDRPGPEPVLHRALWKRGMEGVIGVHLRMPRMARAGSAYEQDAMTLELCGLASDGIFLLTLYSSAICRSNSTSLSVHTYVSPLSDCWAVSGDAPIPHFFRLLIINVSPPPLGWRGTDTAWEPAYRVRCGWDYFEILAMCMQDFFCFNWKLKKHVYF